MTRIDQPWLKDAATQAVCDAITAEGALLLFVGGSVRNALMGVAVSDLDLATDAHPETVMKLAKQAGLKVIPTGIDHGTVTVISGGIPFEITTFRKDVATDGRRATVAFASDIADDAARRDFTMNAIYARPDGRVVDPLGGMADLETRRVRFIGTAQNRIREDYLRSLRYFRFHAWYGDPEAGFDPEALAAIAANLEGLGQLSRERVGAEMLKLLAAEDPAPSVAAMRQSGVLQELLPGSDDRALAPLVHFEAGLIANPIRRLAALGGPDMGGHLRLSKAQMVSWTTLRAQAVATTGAAELGYRLGEAQARDVLLLRAALLEQPLNVNLETDIARGAAAKFPLSARDLMPEITGKALGDTLKRLEADWIASAFTLTRDGLLAKGA
ncbi:CCA tRNA nucleotidyltransferase [Parasedimentitalea psychrophila]|uniref:CCA tRNA nucleotidyltransferase n=1 Tax=Parasedimentitalea psychrophila TaxID=2997337 RepID=A0A9Y2L3Q7_9RHOB|nr:CCA tRNA nucleotidyltransferase [Parasedimentitalea psychrophila]WIY26842.1 CCA tRNA nucleotidyltransferase [Parasedimentitalea psychrophila]